MANVILRDTELEIREGLAEDEREPFTKKLLAALAEIEKLEHAKKVANKGFNESLAEEEDKVKEFRATLRDGKPEMRACTAHYNFSKGIVRFADKKTGKFYKEHEREITEAEKQGEVGEREAEDAKDDSPAA